MDSCSRCDRNYGREINWLVVKTPGQELFLKAWGNRIKILKGGYVKYSKLRSAFEQDQMTIYGIDMSMMTIHNMVKIADLS